MQIKQHGQPTVPAAGFYTLECCTKGGSVWTATAGYRDPMSWTKALQVAEELTLISDRVIYRPVLAQV